MEFGGKFERESMEYEYHEDERMEIQGETQIHDIPEVILSVIFISIKHIRSRNRMALVCRKWYYLERATRLDFTIRGNICDLHFIPRCFQSVVNLDLSLCSPWGYPSLDPTPHGRLIGHFLRQAFPGVKNITIYVRNAGNIQILAQLWPELESVKLVRWHQRPVDTDGGTGLGAELAVLVQNCRMLKNLDLSQFYCWDEDIPPALQAEPWVSGNLRSLNLLKLSTEGFKAQELEVISGVCGNLEELLVVCVFDPRYMDFVGDEALIALARNCGRIRVLHLVDRGAFDAPRGYPEEGFSSEDAQISCQGLEEMFGSLPLLEDLALDLCQNVRDSAPALEALGMQCKKIRSLKLGQFHDVCNGPRPDGVALCPGLEELCIKNCANLGDVGLAAIAAGCRRLVKLQLQGLKQITEMGIKHCMSKLKKTLVDVRVSCCKNLDAAATVRALEPVRECIRNLHIDCVWDKLVLEGETSAPCTAYMSNPIGSSVSSRREVIRYGVEKGQLVSGGDYRTDRWEQTQNCAWEPTLRLGPPSFSPDHNYVDFGSVASPSVLPIMDPLLDLNLMASSHSGLYSSVSGQSSCEKDSERCEYTNGLRKSKNFDNQKECEGADVRMKAHQIEQDNSFGSDLVSESLPIQFVDFMGLNEKHKEWQKLIAGGNDCFEAQGNQCQAFSVVGESSKRTLLANSEGGKLYKKKCMHSLTDAGHCPEINKDNRLNDLMGNYRAKVWKNLNSLSLWIPVGEVLTPLAAIGLESCPVLEEIKVQVEGDCRLYPKPSGRACGLNSLAHYPSLSKLVLDCGEAIGYALSAPGGQTDLSLWERWYLSGVQELHLSELDYWPPQDKEIYRRGLSLPAAGLLSECSTLRKLFVHGTAHEHFMMMLLHIQNLRDVQLREDYYPAPEDDTSTEMRTDSCKRFEAALAERGFPD